MLSRLWRLMIGKPLRTEHAMHERLPIVLALPIFASDALSSVAYATETILRQFESMHIRATDWAIALPISIGIVTLIIMVVVSYWQVIFAYEKGGGSYMVARENLGLFMGLVAASALLVDYVLTVAVSIADCVAQSDSALNQVGGPWDALFDNKPLSACMLVLVILLANLRGVRESGTLFAGPSYGFITVLAIMILAGTFRVLSGTPLAEDVTMPPDTGGDTPINGLLLLRAFASGCAALTGIEAVSNGVQAFRKPEARNAATTLAILGGILAFLFIGITYLAVQYRIAPSEQETVVSQIARATFGKTGPGAVLYYAVQFFTALILFLAANTAFSGFPRLGAILAEDGFLPRQLTSLGERLAYNNGIWTLGILAILFLLVFHGEAHALLPLYTVGVFIAFSTAQLGMVRRSLRQRPIPYPGLTINLIGGVVTTIVLFVIAASKFIARDQPPLFGIPWLYEGAWMALLLMGLVVAMFYAIHRHYELTDRQLAHIPPDYDRPVHHTVIVLVPSRVHRGVLEALKYARSLSPDALAVHISYEQEKEQRLREAWNRYGGDTPLLVLNSPYRSLIEPLMRYIEEAEKLRDDDVVTIVLPEFVPAKWWHTFLHNASGLIIRWHLARRRGIVLVNVRYYLDE
ncbi:MAG: APC family permease [Chloroherpetonaceae bacterium]|nr:APC family permease [Chthonomonadaceae bacterium]MDW8207041.1 APC family permease [Chloroherpetonaceae bacterium]